MPRGGGAAAGYAPLETTQTLPYEPQNWRGVLTSLRLPRVPLLAAVHAAQQRAPHRRVHAEPAAAVLERAAPLVEPLAVVELLRHVAARAARAAGSRNEAVTRQLSHEALSGKRGSVAGCCKQSATPDKPCCCSQS